MPSPKRLQRAVLAQPRRWETCRTRHPQNGCNAPFKHKREGGKPAERIHGRTATEDHPFHNCEAVRTRSCVVPHMVFKRRCAEKTGNWWNASNMSPLILNGQDDGPHRKGDEVNIGSSSVSCSWVYSLCRPRRPSAMSWSLFPWRKANNGNGRHRQLQRADPFTLHPSARTGIPSPPPGTQVW